MDSIKIGRKTHKIKTGDHILWNGACYQFCAGDHRTLKRSEWISHASLVIPKVRLKEINFEDMKKVETGNKEDKNLIDQMVF